MGKKKSKKKKEQARARHGKGNNKYEKYSTIGRTYLFIFSLLAVLLFFSPVVIAQVESFGWVVQYEPIRLIQTWNGSVCNISSVVSPNSTIYDAGLMTKSGLRFNFTFSSTRELGRYNVCGDCDQVPWCAYFDVTTTGKDSGNTLPLFLLLGGFILLAFTVVTKNSYLGFFAGIIFIVSGVYLMIYGLSNIANLYTRSIAIISIGLGVIFCVASVYEHLGDSDDDFGSANAGSDD